jgi:hypothetical protein
MRALLVFVAIASAGCLRTTSYRCDSDTQCGAGAVCEATRYCSFADPTCAGAGDRRYGEQAGIYASRCIGDPPGGGDPDGGVDVDTPMVDGPMPDMMTMGNCPSTYAALSGVTGHVYRVITAQAQWATQAAACMNDQGTTYLAVPDTQTELDALITAANQTYVFLGASDMTEGTWATTNGGTIATNSALWKNATTGEPDDNPTMGGGAGDCLIGDTTNDNIADESCMTTHAAVCECEP